jgi:hypothetical protein
MGLDILMKGIDGGSSFSLFFYLLQERIQEKDPQQILALISDFAMPRNM